MMASSFIRKMSDIDSFRLLTFKEDNLLIEVGSIDLKKLPM